MHTRRTPPSTPGRARRPDRCGTHPRSDCVDEGSGTAVAGEALDSATAAGSRPVEPAKHPLITEHATPPLRGHTVAMAFARSGSSTAALVGNAETAVGQSIIGTAAVSRCAAATTTKTTIANAAAVDGSVTVAPTLTGQDLLSRLPVEIAIAILDQLSLRDLTR